MPARLNVRALLQLAMLGFVVLASAYALSTWRVVLVTGASMRPSLEPGDLCVVARTAVIEVGDVVLLDSGSAACMVHRVVAPADSGYVTKGDANESVDRDIAGPDEIAGRVVAVVPTRAVVRRWISGVRGATLHNQSHSSQR